MADIALAEQTKALDNQRAAERAMKQKGCSSDPTKIDNKPEAHYQQLIRLMASIAGNRAVVIEPRTCLAARHRRSPAISS